MVISSTGIYIVTRLSNLHVPFFFTFFFLHVLFYFIFSIPNEINATIICILQVRIVGLTQVNSTSKWNKHIQNKVFSALEFTLLTMLPFLSHISQWW